jgi:Na+-driven multidrug efflux pump
MCVILARALGARDKEKVQQAVDTGILFALGGGILLAVAGWVASPALMLWTDCPVDCFDGAVLYLRLYFIAAIPILVQNFASGMLTTAGNTRSSLHFMLAGGTAKVVFSIVLCLLLPNKVLAVALGTALSQLLWSVLALLRLCSGLDPVHLHPDSIKPNLNMLRLILSQGLPIGLYRCLFPLANLQIQAAINSFGAVVIAGNSAVIAIENIVSSFTSTLSSGCAVFIGQNLGAEKPERVRRSFWTCIALDLTFVNALCIATYATGRFWLNLLLPDNAEASEHAMARMFCVVLFYWFLGINNVLGQTLQNFGYSSLSSLNSVIAVLGVRVAWMTFVYPHFQTYQMLVACFPCSWIVLFVLNLVMVSVVFHRYRNGKYKKL